MECRFCVNCGSDSTFFSTATWAPHPSGGGIVWQLIEFGIAPDDRPSRTSQDARDILNPATTQARGLKRGEPSPVLLG
jgi:hypothetical protein